VALHIAGSQSLRQVATYKPIHKCSLEELATIQRVSPSGGVLFSQKERRAQKDIARKMVLDLFTLDNRKESLKILTMPSLDWRFEQKLLGKREGDWFNKSGPSNTQITSCENDRYIFYSASQKIPGISTPNSLITINRAPSFAEQSIKTKFVDSFYLANVDDLMAETDQKWDAVWLDYTGPLSVSRLKIISDFYHRCVRETLVVTALKARWSRSVSRTIESHGGYFGWIKSSLPGRVLHEHEYFDSSPMAQFAVSCSENGAFV